MKNIFYRTIIFLSLVLFVGCGEDFLDSPQPSGQIASKSVFESKNGVDGYISGILRLFRAQYRMNGVSTVDVSGVHSIYFARAVKGNDLIQTAWYRYDYANENREPTYRRVSFTWIFSYDMINQANTLIKGVEASTTISDKDKKPLIAQGKTIRAFFYFQLAMEFQHTYSFDKTLPAPPIYTEPSTEGKGMSTLEKVYALIVEDLKYATDNLTEARLGKSYINNRVAYGILARVYQTIQNWSEAEKAAKKAYGSGEPSSLLNKDYGDGFDKISNSEWIWGAEQTDDQTNYYYGAPHPQIDHMNPSYSATHINDDFVKLFSDTDIRKLFVNLNKKVPKTDYRYWVTTKFKFAFSSDGPYMRIPEMLLIEAEAKYHNGDIAGAQNLLFALQSNRDSKAVKSNNVGQALLDEILVERRKELYGEIGVEWFDAKRYRKGILRTGNARLKGNASLKPDDKRFFLKIPQSEIDANDKIGEDVNQGR